MGAAEMLREFHAALDVRGRSRAGVARRMTLHDEGHAELGEALWLVYDGMDLRTSTDLFESLEALARELAGVLYVAYGTADLLGIDLDVALAEVHRANMAKLPDCYVCEGDGMIPLSIPRLRRSVCLACNGTGKGKPIKREDGKIPKPDGWQPPNMAGAIR
jgi:NTP pyrophosphatase (non-canonical NTP hydrolase)